MSENTAIFTALMAPFRKEEVKSRQAPGGRSLSYITARVAMNRLDEVLGPENWWDSYVPGQNGVICKLTIELPSGKTITKEDAGGYAGMADSGDDEKSGFSDAFKRAAAKFGVGRYLYQDGVARLSSDGSTPNQAAPPTERPREQAGGQGDVPTSGKQMFPWLKSLEKEHSRDFVRWADKTAAANGYPYKMVDWSPEQVADMVEMVKDEIAGKWTRPGASRSPQDRPQAQDRNGSRPEQSQAQHQPSGRPWRVPTSGRALFAWIKDQEKIHSVALLAEVNRWREQNGCPARIVDWEGQILEDAFTHACSVLGIDPDTGEKSDDSIAGLRSKFMDIFAELTASMYGPNANDSQFWLTVDSVSATADLASISSVSDCEDAELLKAYIVGAKEALNAPA